jgi:hypothetical protein
VTALRAAPLRYLSWWGAVALLVAAALVALGLGHAFGWIAVFGVAAMAFATCGVVIAQRAPGNPIGWLFLEFGLLTSFAILLDEISIATTRADGSIPDAALAGFIVSNVIYGPVLSGLVIFIVLLFPDGRLPSPRWRTLAWAAGIANAAFCAVNILGAGNLNALDPDQIVPNPLARAGLMQTFVEVAGPITVAVQVTVLIAGLVSLTLRYRRAAGTARQQLKWFGGSGGVFVVLLAIQPYFWGQSSTRAQAIGGVLFAVAITAFPAGTAVAILRYRLYDFDVIVRRTAVYAVLVAVLGAVYIAGVVVGGAAIQALVGRSDTLVVTLTTLAIAVLFQPVRRRTQDVIDRRFARSRYDAARAVDAFGGRMRENVDVAAIETALLGTVTETVGPRHASLWLR